MTKIALALATLIALPAIASGAEVVRKPNPPCVKTSASVYDCRGPGPHVGYRSVLRGWGTVHPAKGGKGKH